MPADDRPSPDVLSWPTRRWTWRVAAVLTALVVLAPLAVWGWLRLHPTTRTDEVRLRHRVAAVRIDGAGGSVLVRPGRADEVAMRSTRSWTRKAPRVDRTWEGDTLHVRLAEPTQSWLDGLSPALVVELHIPAGVPVTARLTSGLADLRGLRGPLDLSGGTATLRVTDAHGPLRVGTDRGAIRASGLTSPTVRATVGAGSASMRFTRAPHTLSVVIGRGAVQVMVPSGSRYRVGARAPHADVRTADGLEDARAADRLDVRAGRGAAAVFGYG
ncbi:hypothetical protein [Streptomyces sp. YKOK-J1]